MSEKYKGYVLRDWEYTYEEKEWSGGHTSEGTGRYTTSYGYEVIDPKTGKSFIVRGSRKDAKKEIDKITDPVLKKQARAAEKKILKAEKQLKKLEAMSALKKEQIDQKIRIMYQQVRDLKESLKNELSRKFS